MRAPDPSRAPRPSRVLAVVCAAASCGEAAGRLSERRGPGRPEGAGRFGRGRRARLLPARPRLRLRRPAGILSGPGLPPGLDRRQPVPQRRPRLHRRPAPRRRGRPRSRELSPGRSRVPDRRDRRRAEKGTSIRAARVPRRPGDAPHGRLPPLRLAPRPRPGRPGDDPVRLVHQGARRGPGGRPGEGPGGRRTSPPRSIPCGPATPFIAASARPTANTAPSSRPGGWPGFPAGPKLVKGDRDARVGALRRTLAAMGDSGRGRDAAKSRSFSTRPSRARSRPSSAATASSPTAPSAPRRPRP